MLSNLPRRVPRALLGVGAALLVLPAAAQAVDQTYTNPTGIYTVVVGDNGNFTAKTGPNHPNGAGLQLIFNGGGRSLVYSYTSGSYFPMSDLFSPKATLSAIPNGVRASKDTTVGSETLHMDEDITTSGTTMENSAVFVQLKVRNDGTAPIDLGARMAVDFKLANDDGPAFTPDGGSELTAATRYTNPAFDYFSLNDNNGTNPAIPTAPTLRTTWTAGVQGLGTTPPDILEMADYGVRTLTPLVPALPLLNTKIGRDNEVRWIWGVDNATASTLAPGATKTYAIATSMGNLNAVAPTNQNPPVITGSTTQGQTLTASTGDWNDTTGLTQFSYQWLRCDAQGANCAPINGETGGTYTTSGADLGSTIRVDVSAAGAGAPASSAVTAPIAAPDTTPPGVPTITGQPASVVALQTGQVDFTGAEAGGTFACRLDAGAWATCASPYVTPGPLADGTHTVDVRHTDDAGNTGAVSSVSWLVDTAAPAAPSITTHPDATTTATAATFDFTGENGATFEYQLDGGAWLTATNPITLPTLGVGAHALKLRQTDAAGNLGAEQAFAWTIEAPLPPAAPAADPETPAPLTTTTVTTPQVAAAPTTGPTPAPAPAATPKRRFSATIGDTPAGNTNTNGSSPSGAATVTVQQRAVQVGCTMSGVTLASCEVALYATIGADGRAVASSARRVLVGSGKVGADATTHALRVRVVLNGTGRELLRRSKTGFAVSVAITGTPVSGAPIRAAGTARLVAKRTTFVLGGFAVDRATLPSSARSALRRIAGLTAGGASVRIVGYTDNSSTDDQHLRALGLRRAKAAQRFLAGRGAKASYTLVTRGDAAPRATNRTPAGRASNRRVVVEVVR
jgi:outer membrane protein OmpA-like peptidoglycan-associated protein